jgi:hypothetical protein
MFISRGTNQEKRFKEILISIYCTSMVNWSDEKVFFLQLNYVEKEIFLYFI